MPMVVVVAVACSMMGRGFAMGRTARRRMGGDAGGRWKDRALPTC